MDAIENKEDTTVKVRQNMFVDSHVLYKSLPQIRSVITELEKTPGREAEKKTFVELYDLLREMHSKLNKSRSVRLDYW
jgi:hypothetical protein